MKKSVGALLLALQFVSFSAAIAPAKGKDRMNPNFSLAAAKNSTATVAVPKPNQTMNEFVDDLLRRMTLEEKLGQLNLLSVGADVTGPVLSKGVEEKIAGGWVGGVFNLFGPTSVRKLQKLAVEKSRLHIPLIFGYDVIHGHRTIFPIPLGLASSWDLDLIKNTARAAAKEASSDGLNWTFSPMVDIARDPRWGRVCEGAGEDPYLGGLIARAMVQGYQGESYENHDRVMACVKHFALYGAAEAGRDYNTVDMSRVRMYNEYLPPYKAAVEAGVGSAMSSFNELDGIPATGNKWLMTDLLRKEWGFKGFVVTDYTAVSEMENHGLGDAQEVSELALNAGIDMDMVSEYFTTYGSNLVKSGKVETAQIDAACRRILEAKYKLGLFADPYGYISEERAAKELLSQDKLALSKEAAVKSMVLLKNDRQILPLNKDKKIAFVGPLVSDKHNLMGAWRGAGDDKDIKSIENALKDTDKLNYTISKGANLIEDKLLMEKLNRDGAGLTIDKIPAADLIKEAVKKAEQADIVVAVLGESFMMSGEAASRSDIGLPENQVALLKALKQTGKPLVLVLMNGRPLTLSWESRHCDAILETWFAGSRAAEAIVDILTGEASPSGKLTMSFPQNVGQVPIYYNAKNTGRPWAANEKYHSQYLDVSNDPLYAFGHGLTYTDFEFGAPTLSGNMSLPGKIEIKVRVKNIGQRPGTETVQLYVRDMVGSITRPVKELKGFQKVTLKQGEATDVIFTLTSDDLRFYNNKLEYIAEPGTFKVLTGPDSANLKEAVFKLTAPSKEI